MRISDWSSDVCSSDLAGSRLHRIPGSANRADDVLHVGEVQRLAKPSDMDIDGALVDIDVVPPDPVEKLRAGEHAAGRGDRQRVVSGQSVSVRVAFGVRSISKKKNHQNT